MIKTAVITGGAGGLGRALTLALVARGWAVAVLDLPGPELESVAAEQVRAYGCDVTDRQAVATVCDRVINDHPSIDLVIYNAGITHIGLFADTALDAHRRVFDINYFGAINVAARLIAPVRQAKGTHLGISSVAGFAPLHRRTAYSASKHALEGFLRTLREEEREFGVHVAIAMPSFVATNVGRPDRQDNGIARPGSASDGIDYMAPVEAAEIIVRGLMQQRDTIPVGRIARMAWIINRLSPRLYARLMMRNIQNGKH
ncbi:SDR family NAD(P)-dependent oxidoreductase [Aerobium aerolatum]|uniref:Short-chain dehydrogenase n=1 Tax=Aquamicrobium aerolatum DSM 21857 TaxID=1121003 RepID=A0A1I3RRY0_9HYPH|nr:SDR family NAD(P)-dependent oxidoreductase [Aquamicrobium aerolatum]SFJ49344.1 Short-chain dehydrogenase [Aquamicrobium aerolatum DSM 21857]